MDTLKNAPFSSLHICKSKLFLFTLLIYHIVVYVRLFCHYFWWFIFLSVYFFVYTLNLLRNCRSLEKIVSIQQQQFISHVAVIIKKLFYISIILLFNLYSKTVLLFLRKNFVHVHRKAILRLVSQPPSFL